MSTKVNIIYGNKPIKNWKNNLAHDWHQARNIETNMYILIHHLAFDPNNVNESQNEIFCIFDDGSSRKMTLTELKNNYEYINIVDNLSITIGEIKCLQK